MRGLSRIDRDIDRAVREYRVIADAPKRPALGEHRDAVAFAYAEIVKTERDIAHALKQLLGCDGGPLLVLFEAEHVFLRSGTDRSFEQFDKRLWPGVVHLFALLLIMMR